MIELLKKCPQIVLLGHSTHARGIIKSLNRDYFISPILYASHRPKGYGFFLQYSFFKQQLPDNEYYTLKSLLELPREYENSDNCILIPLSDFFQNIVQSHLEQFENTYIVSNQSDLIAALPSLKIC